MAFKSVQPNNVAQWIVIGYDDATQEATVVGLNTTANVANVTFAKVPETLVTSTDAQIKAVNMKTIHAQHTYQQGGKYKVAKNGQLVDFYSHNGTNYVKWFTIDTTKTPAASGNQTLAVKKPIRFGMLAGISGNEIGTTLLEEVQILK